MYYQITKLNHVKGHRDYADRGTLVRSTTIAKIKGEALGNLNTGNLELILKLMRIEREFV